MTEPTRLIADIFPAEVSPWPEGVPRSRIRAVVSDTAVTYLWNVGNSAGIQRKDVWLDSEPSPPVNRSGITLSDGTSIRRGAGCGCGNRLLKTTKVWPHL
jgi:hypothetical protein